MGKDNFTFSFKTSKMPEEVYTLLLDIEEWWSGLFEETIKGKSKEVNDEFTFEAGGGAHYSKQKLLELVPYKKIVWLVTESNLIFLNDPMEWTNTKLSFEISIADGKTLVEFIHEGLVPNFECYDVCSGAWTKYLDTLKEKLT
jgi:Activator of Hsp90 ATPase homolog 1-like protein